MEIEIKVGDLIRREDKDRLVRDEGGGDESCDCTDDRAGDARSSRMAGGWRKTKQGGEDKKSSLTEGLIIFGREGIRRLYILPPPHFRR